MIRCCLSDSCENCAGHSFTDEIRVLTYTGDADCELSQEIDELSEKGIRVRVITDAKLPREVIYSVAKLNRNRIQAEINVEEPPPKWLWILMDYCNKCGISLIPHIFNVYPGINLVRVFDICERFKRYGKGRVMVRFYDGESLPNGCDAERMERKGNLWIPNSEYATEVVRTLTAYSQATRVRFGVCGLQDCSIMI